MTPAPDDPAGAAVAPPPPSRARRVALLACRAVALVVLTVGFVKYAAALPPSSLNPWGYALTVNAVAFCCGGPAYYLAGVRLPEWYFRPRAFERSGRLYRWLGVGLFARLVRRGPLAFRPYSGRRGDLASYELGTRDAEASHLLILVLVLALPAADLVRGRPVNAGPLLLINAVVNAFPVLLQRLHRVRLVRLDRALRRRAGRAEPGAVAHGVAAQS